MLNLKVIRHDTAKMACEKWHYSHMIPSGDLCPFGVWENDEFIGTIIFSFPATPAHCKTYGIKYNEILELSRVALKNHKTPVSRIISIATKLVSRFRPKLKLILSYADTAQNHVGAIYQASNWIYVGVGGPRHLPKLNGKFIHERQLSHMVKKGQVKREDCEWIEAKPKHKYLKPLTEEMKNKILPFKQPYPKCVSSKGDVASANHAEEAGSSPSDTLQMDWCL